jgi:hypothetical protein
MKTLDYKFQYQLIISRKAIVSSPQDLREINYSSSRSKRMARRGTRPSISTRWEIL